jgi:hypothetical protein
MSFFLVNANINLPQELLDDPIMVDFFALRDNLRDHGPTHITVTFEVPFSIIYLESEE